MSDADAKVIGDIKEYGWHVVKVFSKSGVPDFAYSIGLYGSFSHPEILVVGLGLDTRHQIINKVGVDVKTGKTFQAASQYSDILDNYYCAFREALKRTYADLFGFGFGLQLSTGSAHLRSAADRTKRQVTGIRQSMCQQSSKNVVF